MFQSQLKFNTHHEILGFVIRKSKDLNVAATIKVYTSLVTPHLEYASNIWPANSHSNSNETGKAQKRFLRYIYVKKEQFISIQDILEVYADQF